jgi:hypothetical protein
VSEQKEQSYLHLKDENLIDSALKQKPEWKKQKDTSQRIDMRHLGPSYKLVIGDIVAG